MTVVFIPKETHADETRVAGSPDTVKAFVKAGLQVQVQTDAGLLSGFPDAQFTAAGATIVADASAARGGADLVLGIRPPELGDVSGFKKGATVTCGLQPMLHLELVKALAEAGIEVFAMDLMPRITRAQKMDILSSQSTASGYQAVLMAAAKLPRFFPLLMTAAGTIKPSRVFVLGVGVAGLQAIATAKRLGAVVEANDIRPAVQEQVESLGAKFIDTGTPPQAETSGGYAKETSEEYQRNQREILTRHIAESQVVITTALIPGRKAPVLVTEEMVKGMAPGSVIVDMAVEMGGNVEGSEAGKTVVKHGVTIMGESNLPGMVAADASRMFARNILSFLETNIKEGKLEFDWEDETVTGTNVCKGGEVTHAPSAEALTAKEGSQ
jgi:proton-translocating NAD(P)+ transhydrogenase subunit alpha